MLGRFSGEALQRAYEAGCRTKLVRLQKMLSILHRFYGDKDFSKFTPEVLFKNMSSADIEALDEDAFMAPINEWKRANDIPVVTGTDEADYHRKHSAIQTKKNQADREAFGGTVKFTLAQGCTTKLSKPMCADDIKQHLSGIQYSKGKCTGKRVGQPCKTCVKFVGDLQEGTACKPCDQFWYPRNSAILKAAKEVQDKHGIDFGVTIVYKPYPKKRTAAPKPQGAKKAKTPTHTDDAWADWRGCVCGGGYHGEMIACDGGCDNWFHLECVGLASAPRGEYICDACGAGARK